MSETHKHADDMTYAPPGCAVSRVAQFWPQLTQNILYQLLQYLTTVLINMVAVKLETGFILPVSFFFHIYTLHPDIIEVLFLHQLNH